MSLRAATSCALLLTLTGQLALGGVLNASAELNRVEFLLGNSAVPEPATWAMMIGGFGLVGAAMRRRGTLATA